MLVHPYSSETWPLLKIVLSARGSDRLSTVNMGRVNNRVNPFESATRVGRYRFSRENLCCSAYHSEKRQYRITLEPKRVDLSLRSSDSSLYEWPQSPSVQGHAFA
ncbi:hypothetical protein TNCV_4326091 [Trichonephila clavipes]|nr:hypothetical protein TNCV_4326091 [Trichonephila clavipes]